MHLPATWSGGVGDAEIKTEFIAYFVAHIYLQRWLSQKEAMDLDGCGWK